MTPLELIRPADPLKVAAPLSPAVTCGNRLRVPGIPADDANGRLAVGEFTARMTPVMANITGILQAAGADGRRVTKVNVFQTRRADFAE